MEKRIIEAVNRQPNYSSVIFSDGLKVNYFYNKTGKNFEERRKLAEELKPKLEIEYLSHGDGIQFPQELDEWKIIRTIEKEEMAKVFNFQDKSLEIRRLALIKSSCILLQNKESISSAFDVVQFSKELEIELEHWMKGD